MANKFLGTSDLSRPTHQVRCGTGCVCGEVGHKKPDSGAELNNDVKSDTRYPIEQNGPFVTGERLGVSVLTSRKSAKTWCVGLDKSEVRILFCPRWRCGCFARLLWDRGGGGAGFAGTGGPGEGGGTDATAVETTANRMA